MGDLQAEEWAELSREHGIPLNSAVAAHMSSNLYPPVDSSFVPVALEAIEHADAEDWTRQIELPNGVVLSVGEIISQLHLQAFVNSDE